MARDSSGTLWYYQGSGKPSAPFKTKIQVGAGWNMYTLMTGVSDVTGDGVPDLIARDSAGILWLYQGTGTSPGIFAPRVQVGSGWNIFDALTGVGDLDGDGKPDLIARDTNGTLYFYKGTGSSTSPFAPRVQVGPGWGVYDSMTGVGDWSGDSKPDLVTRDGNGQLYLYQGTGSAPAVWAPKAQVGTGWGIYDLLF